MSKGVSFNYKNLAILILTIFLISVHETTYGQPSDACSGAPALAVNSTCTTTSFLLAGTYSDGGEVLSGCQSLNRDDGWYKFTGTGEYVTVKSTSSDQRHVLALWSGACGALTLMKCEEVAIGVSTRLAISTTAATTYYIQIHRTNGNGTANLNGTICVESLIAPGGIAGGLGSWFSADGLLTTTGTTVTTWKNNIGGNPNCTNSNGTPNYSATLANFNPAIQFDNNDYLNGPADGTTFTGVNTGTVIMANRYRSGAVIAKWEETGVFLNRVSMEGMGNYIRYDHPTDVSYMINSPTVAIDNWILSTGLADPVTDYLYINGLNEGSDVGGSNTPTAMGSIMFGSNTNGSFGANTDLSEIIFYTTTLSAADRNKVESYMATKYGITLGSTASLVNYTSSTGLVFWTGTSTYQNDVAGIGRDDNGNLSQEKSKSVNSDAFLTMALTDMGGSFNAPNNFNANLEYMMWGNNNGSIVESTTELPSGYTYRIPREWVIQETGTVGTVSIQFDISTFTVSGAAASEFFLLIDEDKDGDFTTGTIRSIAPTSYVGGVLSFDGVDFANGEIFTIGIVIPALPIEFISLEVEGHSSQNTITWITGKTTNSSHFEVMRSTDASNWNVIGEVPISNTTDNQFNFIDTYISTNTTYYYRIKEIGKDGDDTYTKIVSTSQNDISSLEYVVYPNPAKESLFILMDIEPSTKDPLEATIFSVLGKVMSTTSLSEQKNLLNLKEFAPGTYWIEIKSSTGHMAERKLFIVE